MQLLLWLSIGWSIGLLAEESRPAINTRKSVRLPARPRLLFAQMDNL